MFYIPVISTEQKEKLKWEFKKRLTISYIIDIIVVFMILNLFLIFLNLFVFAKITQLKKTAELELIGKIELEIKDKESVIKDFNKILLRTNKISLGFFDMSSILYNLSSLVPENTRFYSVQLNKNDKKMQVQGNVPWREDVLSLQSNLGESDDFVSVEFPLSNFTKKENIDFYFSAEVVVGSMK